MSHRPPVKLYKDAERLIEDFFQNFDLRIASKSTCDEVAVQRVKETLAHYLEFTGDPSAALDHADLESVFRAALTDFLYEVYFTLDESDALEDETEELSDALDPAEGRGNGHGPSTRRSRAVGDAINALDEDDALLDDDADDDADDDGDELDDDDDDFADASLYAVLPLEELCTLLRGDPDAHVDCDALAQVALETSRREGSRKTVGILDGFIDALRDRAQSDSARKLLADAYFALGEVHHQAGEIAHAIAAFKQAARTRCDFAEAHGRIAALYFDNDDVKSALEAWRTQIALTPDDPEPYFASAVALEGMGRPDRAAEVLTSLLLHDPENASALDALVRLAEEGGRFAEAESCRERILAMGPPRLLEDMAVWAKYQVEAGNFDGVLDHLHREELDAPSLSFLNLLKAIVFLTREDPDNVEVELMLVRDKVGGSAAALEPALQSLERVFGSPRIEPLRRAIAEHVASPGA